MRDPHHPGQRLKWEWVIDYYHACEYIYKMSEALFHDAQRAQGWAQKMCRWLKTKPGGINRVLHSAAAIRRRRIVVGAKRKQYRDAYNYLRKRIPFLDYVRYRHDHLPIGSGVTEAACKTVFTQRMKQSNSQSHPDFLWESWSSPRTLFRRSFPCLALPSFGNAPRPLPKPSTSLGE
jgi:hypothetical protein